ASDAIADDDVFLADFSSQRSTPLRKRPGGHIGAAWRATRGRPQNNSTAPSLKTPLGPCSILTVSKTVTITPRASCVRGAVRGELLHPLSSCRRRWGVLCG